MSSDQSLSADAGGTKPDNPLDSLLSSLERIVVDHPGFMRHESGFEVIHADWPCPNGNSYGSPDVYPRDA